MAEFLRDDLLQKLYAIAEQHQRSINDLVEEVIARYRIEDTPPNSLARLAAGGREMPAIGNDPTVSERADEILNNEFADYMLNKLNRSHETDSD